LDLQSGAIPIAALFGHGTEPNPNVDVREMVDEADVVLALDVMTQGEHLVFGRGVLAELAVSGEERELCVLIISLDQDTDELANLSALVETVKGHHDYLAEGC
jgi:hypothetical protein